MLHQNVTEPVVYTGMSIFIFHKMRSSPDSSYLDELNDAIYLQKCELHFC